MERNQCSRRVAVIHSDSGIAGEAPSFLPARRARKKSLPCPGTHPGAHTARCWQGCWRGCRHATAQLRTPEPAVSIDKRNTTTTSSCKARLEAEPDRGQGWLLYLIETISIIFSFFRLSSAKKQREPEPRVDCMYGTPQRVNCSFTKR